ncbi:MAG: hypothetical protein M1457_14060 [bacterium]|nr:hypothetical protein [bacterium]
MTRPAGHPSVRNSGHWRMIVLIIFVAAAGGAARAALVTSGSRTATSSDGLSLTIDYNCANNYTILDENTEQMPTDVIHLPKGAEVRINCSWSGVPPSWPEGSYLDKAYLTLVKQSGDETQEITGGQTSAETSFVMASTPGYEDNSPGAVVLRVVWKKLEVPAGEGTPAIYTDYELIRSLGINRPRRTVQVKAPGDPDDKAVTYNDFEFFLTPWNTPYLDELTAAENVFDVTFGIHVYCPSPDGPESFTGRAGVLARVIYLGSGYMSEWSTTNEDGDTTVTLGAGSIDLAATGNFYAPELYVSADPLTADGSAPCGAYMRRILSLANLRDFIGTLNVRVSDIDGNALRAAVNVWGGPYLPNEMPAAATADETGLAAVKVKPWVQSSESADQAVHLAPYVNLAGNVTNVVDDAQMELVDGRPAYLSPAFALLEGAYTYGGKGNSSRAARLQYMDKDENVLEEVSIEPRILRDSVIATGANRHYWRIDPTTEQEIYKARVVYDDLERLSDDPIVASGVEEFRVQARWRPRSSGGVSLQFRICAVGAWAGQSNDFYTRLDPGIQALQMQGVNEVMPVPVSFSHGPTFTPEFSFYQMDIWRIQQVVAGLDAAQKITPGVDCIIGIVPPNYLDSTIGGKVAGIQFEGYRGAVLVDPSKIKGHTSVHEFLHTLGIDDVYESDYYGDGQEFPPPSANGYKALDQTPVVTSGGRYPSFQAIMYDHAMSPWPRGSEFMTLLDFCADPIPLQSGAAPARRLLDLPIAEPIVNLSGAIKTDNATYWTAELNPVFASAGQPFNPYANRTYGDYYVRVYNRGGAAVATVYLPGNATFNASRAAGESGPAGGVEDVAIDQDVRAVFGVNLAMSDADIGRIEMGPSNEWGQAVGIWRTIQASANAPQVSEFLPAPGPLGSAFTLSWKAIDADPEDAIKLLSHRVLVSGDAGQTWSQASVAVGYDWGSGRYSCSLTSGDFPAGSQYAFQILASDGLRTGSLTTPASYQINGYANHPVVSLGRTQWNARRAARGRFAFALPAANQGEGVLTIAPDPASLPAWMSAPTEPVRIAPHCDGRLLLTGDQPGSGAFSATIRLLTNDPAQPVIDFPIGLEQGGAAEAPQIHHLDIDPRFTGARPYQPGESVAVNAWEYSSRGDLDTTLTVLRLSAQSLEEVARVAMAPGHWPGQYVAAWQIPADAPDGVYYFEIGAVDPATGQSDADGLQSGHDARLMVRRFNQSPVFALPAVQTTALPAVEDQDVVLTYRVSDPDGDELDLSLQGLPFPVAWDRAKGEIRWRPTRNQVGAGYELVLTARDPHGAISTRRWTFTMQYAPSEPPADRAQPGPIVNDLVLTPGLTCDITVNETGQQGCRVDYRVAGQSDWILGAIVPYTELEPFPGYYYIHVTWDWTTLGLLPNTAYELRFVNIDENGQPDQQPVIRRVTTGGAAGTVTRVDAPVSVKAGETFVITVTARNDSFGLWKPGCGIRLAARGGDPFYSGPALDLGKGSSSV